LLYIKKTLIPSDKKPSFSEN